MDQPLLVVDSDVRFARRPPAALRRDPVWLERTKQRVLARGWHVVSRVAATLARESAFPLVLLPGSLDESIVISRDRKDRLHGLSNVCTHRGGRVCDAAGSLKMFTCPLHGRTFRLDGELLAAPGHDDSPGFPSPSDSLAHVAAVAWGPVVFASIDPDTPLASVVAETLDAVPVLPGHSATETPSEETVAAHWTLVVDEILGTFPPDALRLAPGGVASKSDDVLFAFLFPATFVELHPEALVVRSVRPESADSTRIVTDVFLARDPAADPSAQLPEGSVRTARFAAALRAAASIQLGVASARGVPSGYAPHAERALHHFHRLLAQRIG